MNDIKNKVRVRKFQKADAEEVQELIVRNFLEVNSKDYGIKAMQELAVNYGIDKILQIASYAHMYVFELDDRIVGVGSISSFWGSETESILLTIFVLPELHGLYLRADRIEIPSSITATEFYRKFGYDYKDGIKELDSEQHYRLEKYKKIG